MGIDSIDESGTDQTLAEMGALGSYLQGYDLSTPVDPFPSYNFAGSSGPYATTAGDFVLGSWYPTFTARVVPEPGTTALYALAGILLGIKFLSNGGVPERGEASLPSSVLANERQHQGPMRKR